jgi:hypothetical protein
MRLSSSVELCSKSRTEVSTNPKQGLRDNLPALWSAEPQYTLLISPPVCDCHRFSVYTSKLTPTSGSRIKLCTRRHSISASWVGTERGVCSAPKPSRLWVIALGVSRYSWIKRTRHSHPLSQPGARDTTSNGTSEPTAFTHTGGSQTSHRRSLLQSHSWWKRIRLRTINEPLPLRCSHPHSASPPRSSTAPHVALSPVPLSVDLDRVEGAVGGALHAEAQSRPPLLVQGTLGLLHCPLSSTVRHCPAPLHCLARPSH